MICPGSKKNEANRRRGAWWYARFSAGPLVWIYTVGVLAVWALLRIGGDRWWFPTLMLYGPRWIYGLPLLVLAPLAATLRRRLIWPLGIAAAVVMGPIMGLCVPWARLGPPDGRTIRVLTCNAKGHCGDNALLNTLIQTAGADVVALQGCWGNVQIRWPAGWNVYRAGELLVASRYPMRDNRSLLGVYPPHRWPRAYILGCVVQSPAGDIPFVSLHLPSPHDGIERLLDRTTVIRPSKRAAMINQIALRRRAAEEVRGWIDGLSDAVIVAGDFNMPTDSAIYREFWSGLANAFSQSGLGFGYTEWPTVHGWQFGVRIDHILMGPRWRPQRSWVGPDVGSDHLPLLANLVAQ